MIFAIIFVAAFVIGLISFVMTDKWWWGFVVATVVLIVLAVFDGQAIDGQAAALHGVTLYFGVPIVFLGNLFGAYIVQLRRAPDLDELESTLSESSVSQPSESKPSE